MSFLLFGLNKTTNGQAGILQADGKILLKSGGGGNGQRVRSSYKESPGCGAKVFGIGGNEKEAGADSDRDAMEEGEVEVADSADAVGEVVGRLGADTVEAEVREGEFEPGEAEEDVYAGGVTCGS